MENLTCPLPSPLQAENLSIFYPSLSPQSLEEIVLNGRKKLYDKDMIILYEQDDIQSVHILLSGEVCAYKFNTSHEVCIYNINDKTKSRFLSVLTSLEPQMSFCNIIAKSFCEVCVININTLKNLSEKYPDIKNIILEECFEKIGILNNYLEVNVMANNTQKVLFLITNDTARFNATKRSQIANSLNMRPETLSRIIKKLLDDGMIACDEMGNLSAQA